jgi:hypothetical protein
VATTRTKAKRLSISSPSGAARQAPITGYNVYRGGVSGGETLVATVGDVTCYTDASVPEREDVLLPGQRGQRRGRRPAFERGDGEVRPIDRLQVPSRP